MKQKKYFILAAAAILMAACSENDIAEKQSPQVTTENDAVVFDAYTSRGLTRAGASGVIGSTDALKVTATTKGFGVFGYYTNSEMYNGTTKPNFFYNQQVYWNSTGTGLWYYSPVKYWPNEFGSDAISDQVDRVTFFAYAPWVDVDPLTGVVKADDSKDPSNTNIISMTRNNVTGDPFIRYSATMDPTNCTDLLYGVAAEDFTSSNSGVNPNNIKKGYPYKSIVKPGTDPKSKIYFDFKHSLAQLKVKINADVKDMTTESTDIQKTKTRIWVRSVTFEGITKDGSLNLNSVAPDPQWYDINGINKITTGSLTVYDGLKDEREPLEKAATETPASFNPNLIQSAKYVIDSDGKIDDTKFTLTGVTKDPVNLFNGESVFAIPTGEKMKVTIVYDVETYDPNLAFYLSDGETQGSSIENKITKTIDAFGAIKAGYCYNLKLHLGMRTVDFDADVTAWQDVDAEADLPSNIPTFAVGVNSTNTRDITLPAAGAFVYDYAVSGLTVNTTPSMSTSNYTGGGTVSALTASNASGVSKGTITTIVNATTKKQDQGYVFITDATATSNKVYLHIYQSPQPLNLTISAITAGDEELTIGWNSDLSYTKASEIKNGGTVKVTKNGVVLSEGGANGYTLSDSAKKITLYGSAKAAAGDVYTVYIQSGDATAESVTKSVPNS